MKKIFATLILGLVIGIGQTKSQIWTNLDSFPGAARYGVAAFGIDSVGYVGAMGGAGSQLFKDFYGFRVNSGTWISRAQFPGNARRTGIGFPIGSYGYAGLGWSGSSDYTDFYRYNPSSNSWSQMASYPGGGGRVNFCAATATKGYIGGGNYSSSTSSYQSDWWEYDPTTNTWDSLPNFPFGNRVGGVAFAIGCQVFVGMGHNGTTGYNDLWSYNAQTRTWHQVASFPGIARMQSSSFVINGRAIVGGGYQLGTGYEFGDYYSYDPITNSWDTIPGFKTGRRGVARGFTVNNVGYVATGFDSTNSPLDDLWSYRDTTHCDTRLYDELSSCGPFFSSTYGLQFDTSGVYIDSSGTGNCVTITSICVQILEEHDDTLVTQVCDSFLAPNGTTYYSSGIYRDTVQSKDGCDSIFTLDLTINNSWSDSVIIAQCGYYTAPSGNVYTQSGNYIDSLPTIHGCDSIYYLDLTIYPSGIIDTLLAFSCEPYQGPSGKYYTESGKYWDTIVSPSGCDSIYYLDLSITIIDAKISKSGNFLFAVTPQAAYQWIDCDSNNAHIQGETNQSYLITRNGRFACVVIKNTCRDTSDCFEVTGVGIEGYSNSTVTISPNPSSGPILIDLDRIFENVIIQVFDLSGKSVVNKMIKSMKQANIDINNPGLYILEITLDQNAVLRKQIVIQN